MSDRKEKPICIVYASDNRFAEILGVSLVSLFEQSRDAADILVYILDSGISDVNKDRLRTVFRDYDRREPIFLTAKNINQELNLKVNLDRGSLSQYARLFLSSLLPEHLDRVLYLDCDILFKQSIKKLWDVDLQGKTIGALMDAFSTYYRKNIDLQPDDIMFNSGVMLIDLVRWKEKKIEEQLMTFIKKKKGAIQQGDQGALNAVLSHDVYCFSPIFNSVTIFYDFTYPEIFTYRQPPEFYPEEAIKEAVEHPVLVHFTTSIFSKRPWIAGSRHRYANDWINCKEKSPWKDVPLWEDQRSGLKKGILNLLFSMPRPFVLWIARIMQVYVRPFYYGTK